MGRKYSRWRAVSSASASDAPRRPRPQPRDVATPHAQTRHTSGSKHLAAANSGNVALHDSPHSSAASFSRDFRRYAALTRPATNLFRWSGHLEKPLPEGGP